MKKKNKFRYPFEKCLQCEYMSLMICESVGFAKVVYEWSVVLSKEHVLRMMLNMTFFMTFNEHMISCAH